MAGLDFSCDSPKEQENEKDVSRNTRNGLWLLALYVLLYGGFVAWSALAPESMAAIPFGGMNVAILYGFGLIGAALVVALIYSWMCRTCAKSGSSKSEA